MLVHCQAYLASARLIFSPNDVHHGLIVLVVRLYVRISTSQILSVEVSAITGHRYFYSRKNPTHFEAGKFTRKRK
jgi:hypothetical protein